MSTDIESAFVHFVDKSNDGVVAKKVNINEIKVKIGQEGRIKGLFDFYPLHRYDFDPENPRYYVKDNNEIDKYDRVMIKYLICSTYLQL